jgi:hypothetical protein
VQERGAGRGAGRRRDAPRGTPVEGWDAGRTRMRRAAGEAPRARQWRDGGQVGARTAEGRDGANRDEAMRERTIPPNWHWRKFPMPIPSSSKQRILDASNTNSKF